MRCAFRRTRSSLLLMGLWLRGARRSLLMRRGPRGGVLCRARRCMLRGLRRSLLRPGFARRGFFFALLVLSKGGDRRAEKQKHRSRAASSNELHRNRLR
jgi:hypothetical protein